MPTPAEQLETCLRLLNHPRIDTAEKPAWVLWLARNMHRLEVGAERLQLRIDERTRASVEQWGSHQRFARAHAAQGTARDLSAPSHFNTRKDYTTR